MATTKKAPAKKTTAKKPATKAPVKKTTSRAAATKTTRSVSAKATKPAAKKAPAKAAAAKKPVARTAAKKTTTKKAAAAPAVKSFRPAATKPQSFFDFRITAQTVYWVLIMALIIFVQLWILKLQYDVMTLIDAQNAMIEL